MTALLLPTLELCVSVDDLEARWSKALAKELRGEQEFQIEGGRIDVVTPRFAIEVDFLRKWHEGIGQALHYASSTGKLPMVALILPESAQSISASTLETLSLIERLASEQRIRLLLLSPRNC
ncbi:hypothetical protein [Luteitalea sp. TBR-22]|uniref:hypothetical protein n=1 Tax=Luteitalea sp. TBR-22 TaxID=2802971 RepID=UPI001EF6DB3A|nr:hypothetical protein [Luteitalea sp. TBR-22]